MESDERVLPSASSCCRRSTSCSGPFRWAAASHRRGPSSSLESLLRSLPSQWPTEVLQEGWPLPLPPQSLASPCRLRLTALGPAPPGRRGETHTRSRCCPGDGSRRDRRDLEEARRGEIELAPPPPPRHCAPELSALASPAPPKGETIRHTMHSGNCCNTTCIGILLALED